MAGQIVSFEVLLPTGSRNRETEKEIEKEIEMSELGGDPFSERIFEFNLK